MKNKQTIAGLIVLITSMVVLYSCEKEETEKTIDEQLYQMATEKNNIVWYKKSDELLEKSPGSGHSQPYLRTWYNQTAAKMLDADGKIKEGTTFDEKSLVVKELINNESQVEGYAILYKDSNSENADNKGWVWGYTDEEGGVVVSSDNKGSGCIQCHTQSGHIDYMLMNKFFP